MKTSILLFTIFSLISASKVETSVIEKIQCLITNEVLYEYAVDIYEIIKTKDVVKIIEALVEAYPIIKEEVLKCWNKDVELFSNMRFLEEQKRYIPSKCESDCYGSCSHIFKYFEYYKCSMACIEKNCKKK